MNFIKYFYSLIFFFISGYISICPIYNPSLNIITDPISIASAGLVNYTTTNASPQDARFTLYGDGYFTTQTNFYHQFSPSAGGYLTTTFFNQPYKKHIPTVRTQNIGATGGGNTVNNKIFIPSGDQSKVATSWSPSEGIENYFLLIFENTSAVIDSGYVEFYYNDLQLSLNTSGILDYGWVYNRTHSPGGQLSNFNQKLKWEFNNLMPGEQRVVYIPMTTRVQEGTRLHVGSKYISNVSGSSNNFIEAAIVSSGHPHDPNVKIADKQCVHPNISEPQSITYTVRFQNEGTAPANNVLLMDYLDLNLFDVNTLEFIDSEYNYTYQVIGNLLEINFNNIQLPGLKQHGPKIYSYDDTESFIQFKICSLSNIPLGQLTNQVGIIFDTQPVIMTNLSMVPISDECAEQTKSCASSSKLTNTNDFESLAMTVRPNPVQDVLYIDGLEDHEAHVTIFNDKGEAVFTNSRINKETNRISIIDLASGIYFVQIRNEMLNITKKVIKI